MCELASLYDVLGWPLILVATTATSTKAASTPATATASPKPASASAPPSAHGGPHVCFGEESFKVSL